MAQVRLLSILSLLVLAVLQGTNAVTYSITNTAETTPGGQRFNNEIGSDYTSQTLSTSTDFIWRLFQQNTEADRKNVQHVSLFIDDWEKDGVLAYTSNDEIHANARYIADGTDVRFGFTGVVYHEMTHVWQWSNAAPMGLIDGIADFVRLRAGYASSQFVQPGEGDKWDQGYEVTARFLDYCNSLSNGFVAQLNKKMKDTYSDDFFVELLGKTVDQLWSEYKAQYQT